MSLLSKCQTSAVNPDAQDLVDAVIQLRAHERGRRIAPLLRWFMQQGGLGLDAGGQRAVLTILRAAWGAYPGTAMGLLDPAHW